VAEFIYSLNDGGAETLIKNYCKVIDRTKYDVVIIAMYDIGDSVVKEAIQNLEIPIVYVYPHRTIVYRAVNFLIGRAFIKNRFKKIITQYRISTIHAHTAVLRYLLYSKSELDHVKLLYTCHSTPSRYFSGRLKKEDTAARYLIQHNRLQMVALHNAMAEELNSWFSIDNTIVIRNGLILNEYNRGGFDKEEIRQKLGIKKNAFVIGHVGRFIKEKNHNLIIKVFIEVKKHNQSAFLLLIGDGELENEIKKNLDDNGFNNDYLMLSHRKDIPR